MKEIYKASLPKRIVFGDPMYFESFKGQELENLVVDLSPPAGFSVRVVLDEFPCPCEEVPDFIARTTSIILAPEETIGIYANGMKYESQQESEKQIGVDTAKYLLQVNDRQDIICTGGDGYWGAYCELYRERMGCKLLDAISIEICAPEHENMETMRQQAQYFFPDMQLLERQENTPTMEQTM